MALPEAIAVRYTEEEAGYVSFRPVVRQTFRLNELLDMVLTVTGKDVARIRQILRSGTVVYHFYRYWWSGFEADEAELAEILRNFPDPDPARQFRAALCTAALLVDRVGPLPGPVLLRIERTAASRRRLLRRHTFWNMMMDAAAVGPLSYAGYSYAHRGDLFGLELTPDLKEKLLSASQSIAPRDLRFDLRVIANASHILFVCPRAS